MSADWPAGVGRVVLAETDSTIAEAARRAAAGSGPVWILAGFQTAGRGRRGRPWVSPPGNFHATLLMRPSGGPAQAALRSFIAALALHEALGRLTGLPSAFALKWPNDVLLNGGKVSGILLESLGSQGGVDHLAVGIGVNLIAAPDPAEVEPGATPPVSVLAETGLRLAPEALLGALAPAFAAHEATLAAQGFAPIRAAWLAQATRLGETVTARTGTATRTGIFETIDESGALVLRTPRGRETLPAADLYF
ncbi:MAG: biotin--[acetyl-CoA-carboxylase] ligase [Gemmobacter sp.]|uniref:biotin--[acetyl-CoA-carboxylase] ligase n=1 Tax=Gemmobacter sp. TaxID=1898957 RepID=UPI00391CF8FF